jgi:glycosyltransferase involved in cell wall biosynthesis
VYDVSYLASEEWYPYKLDRFRIRYYISSIRRASRILVPSEFSRLEVVRFLPEVEPKLRKIHLGVSSEFKMDDSLGKKVRTKLGLPERFLLHVGDIHSRRRVGEVRAAARALGWPLVLVGRPLENALMNGGFEYHFSGLGQEDLIGIYNAATVLVYPSLYEGFGLPLLEAMACGLPVVAANRASIPEVCGDAAILVEPNGEAFLAGIQEILESREEYIARGLERVRHFTWEETARKTFQVYEELLQESAKD